MFFEGGVIADSYARSGHDHRLMDKVWMRSFVGESLSCSLQGGVHAAWAGTQSFLRKGNTSTIQLSQCERGDNTSSTGDNTSSAGRGNGCVTLIPQSMRKPARRCTTSSKNACCLRDNRSAHWNVICYIGTDPIFRSVMRPHSQLGYCETCASKQCLVNY